MIKSKLFKVVRVLLPVLFLIVLISCGADKGQTYTAGIYTSTQTGKNGPVEVEVTFADKKIKSVEVVSHTETPGISDAAIERIPAQIVKDQTLAVDVVAGASYTSNAILIAVADAVNQAGGDSEALAAVVAPAKEGKIEELSCDIVIVGAGAAGLSAGISATDTGADVIVIEKGANGGVSNGANAGGPIAVGTRIQKEEGEGLTLEQLFTHMSGYGNSTINDSLLKKVLSVTGRTIDYFEDLGMNIFLRTDNYGLGFRARHGFRDRGVARAQFLIDRIEENGGTVLFETAGDSLIRDVSGTVTGVNAVKPGGDKVIIHAKAVLLATGGYLGSEEIISEKIRRNQYCSSWQYSFRGRRY